MMSCRRAQPALFLIVLYRLCGVGGPSCFSLLGFDQPSLALKSLKIGHWTKRFVPNELPMPGECPQGFARSKKCTCTRINRVQLLSSARGPHFFAFRALPRPSLPHYIWSTCRLVPIFLVLPGVPVAQKAGADTEYSIQVSRYGTLPCVLRTPYL